MGRFWRIKHWIKYQPAIAFYSFWARVFRGLYILTDKFGYWFFGAESWDEAKKREGVR